MPISFRSGRMGTNSCSHCGIQALPKSFGHCQGWRRYGVCGFSSSIRKEVACLFARRQIVRLVRH
jgi:hypothetical protein